MDTCPDCVYVKEQIKNDDRYEIKEFLRLRDTSPVFDEAKKNGAAGIPCFVLEDGTVTLVPEDAGLQSRPIEDGAVCSLDGSGC